MCRRRFARSYRWTRRCRTGLPCVSALVIVGLVYVTRLPSTVLPWGDGRGQKSSFPPVNGRHLGQVQFLDSTEELPTLVLGEEQQSWKKLIIGIPTTPRVGRTYLFGTLRSLTENSDKFDRQDVLVVVQITGSESFLTDVTMKIKKRFRSYVEDGFIQVVYRRRSEKHDVFQLKTTYNDSIERVKWRTDQNEDAASLLRFCSRKSDYYLHLEDDVISVPGYLPKIFQFIEETDREWKMLEFSLLGAIAKLFHGEDLPKLVSLVKLYLREQPLDFLMYNHLKLSFQTERIMRIPSLFKHVGQRSTLANQTRLLVDPLFFILEPKARNHSNPPAHVVSSLEPFQGNTMENVYSNKSFGFFWGQARSDNETIVITFKEPQLIDRLVIESGFSQPRDTDGVVEEEEEEDTDLPQKKDMVTDAVLEISTDLLPEQGNNACQHYEVISKFKDGRMEVTRVSMGENGLERISCLRVSIFNVKNCWVFIREIDIRLVIGNAES